MNGHMTMLVIIVNFPTSLVIQMACAGGPDLQQVKWVHKLYYQIFFLQILHDNTEIMEEFTSKIRLQYTV